MPHTTSIWKTNGRNHPEAEAEGQCQLETHIGDPAKDVEEPDQDVTGDTVEGKVAEEKATEEAARTTDDPCRLKKKTDTYGTTNFT